MSFSEMPPALRPRDSEVPCFLKNAFCLRRKRRYKRNALGFAAAGRVSEEPLQKAAADALAL